MRQYKNVYIIIERKNGRESSKNEFRAELVYWVDIDASNVFFEKKRNDENSSTDRKFCVCW